MKTKNKILMMVFAFFAFLSFGVMNVNAKTININSKNDYISHRTINEETTLKLTNDISLEGADFDNGKLEIGADLIIDLNGYTLTVPSDTASIHLNYRGDYTVTIRDSSNAKSGMIIKTGAGKSINIHDNSATVTNVTLNIDGINYKNAGPDYGIEIFDFFGENGQIVNVNIKNSIFEIANTFYGGYSELDAYYPSTLNLDIKNSTVKSKRINTNVYILSNNPTLTFADIMVEGTGDSAYEAYGDGDKLADNQLASTGYKKIEIKKVERFDIEVPTFEPRAEGYDPIDAENISIATVGGNRTIHSVEVSGNDFIVNGPSGDILVNDGTPNTSFNIKPKDDLKYGVHTATVRVKDTDNNIFFTEVSFNVNAYGETQVVTTEADLRKFTNADSRNYPVVKTVKLGADITLEEQDGWIDIYVLDGKTLDLAGFTLTTDNYISVIYGTDNIYNHPTATFELIDSSVRKTGAITTNITDRWNLFQISERYQQGDNAQLTYNFNLDGGTYNALTSSAGIFGFSIDDVWANNPDNRFNFNVKNATFNLNPNEANKLIYTDNGYTTKNDFKISLENITVNLNKMYGGLINGSPAYTVDEIIPENQEIIYPDIVADEVVGTKTALRTDLASTVQLLYITNPEPTYQIKVQRIERFEITAPIFEPLAEGYDEHYEEAISIDAIGSNRTIDFVDIDNHEEFIFTGLEEDDEHLVTSGTPNTVATIKPIPGLSVGIHTARIRVVDIEGNEYYATVSFEVTRNPEIPIDINSITDYDDEVAIDRTDTDAIYRLTDDINLDNINDVIRIYHNITIDLNGFDLITNKNYILNLEFMEDGKTFKIIDTSVEKTGKLIGTNTDANAEIIFANVSENSTGTIELDGITVESDTGYLFDSTVGLYNTHLNVNIKDSTIKKDGKIFGNLGVDGEDYIINFENTIIEPKNAGNLVGFSNTNMSLSDLIDTESQIVRAIPSDGSDFEDVSNETVVNLVEYKKIIIESNECFQVTAPIFADEDYGYSSVDAQTISINAIGSNRTIASVDIDNHTDFIFTGLEESDEHLVTSGTPNEIATIKPNTGLSVGTYSTIITVEDIDGNIYIAPVTFEVRKKDITPTVTVNGTHTYTGSAIEPTVVVKNGETTIDASQYTVNYENNTNASENARVVVSAKESANYAWTPVTETFTIAKKIITVTDENLTINNKSYDGTPNIEATSTGAYSELSDQITTIATMDAGNNEFVGTKTGTITATLSDNAYNNYSFVGNAKTHTKTNVEFSITALSSTITDISGGTRQATKTKKLDLRTLISLDPATCIDDVIFTISPAVEGVSIDEDGYSLIADNTATAGTSVRINVNFAGKNLGGTDTNEYNAATETSIYVMIVEKPTHALTTTPTNLNMTYGDTLLNAFESTNGGTVTYTSNDATVVSVDANTGLLTANKYSDNPVAITVNIAETDDYAATSFFYDVSVAKKTLNVGAGSYQVSKEYDKSTSAGTGINTFDYTKVNASDDVTVVGTPRVYTNANVHTETLPVDLALDGTAKGNYQLANTTVQVPYVITQKTIKIKVSYTACTYNGTSCVPAFTLREYYTEEGIDSSTYDVVVNPGSDTVNAGEIWVTITAKSTSNYTWTPYATFYQVYKADFPEAIPALSRTVLENKVDTYYINFSDISLPGLTNPVFESVATEGDLISSAEVDSANSRIKYTVASEAAGTTGKLKITVSSRNHANGIVIANITAVSKTPVIIGGLELANKDYDGSPIVPSNTLTATEGYDVDDLVCRYTGSNSYNDTNAPTNAGSYTLTCSVPESDEHYMGSKTWNFVINKINPTVQEPTDLIGIIGNTLSSVTLPSGFSWQTPTTPLTVGTASYKATYTPSTEEQINYNIVTDIDVSVYTKNKYGITTSVIGGNGTITTSENNIVEGSSREITFTPNTGYMIDTVLIDEIDRTSDVNVNKINLTVNDDITVKVSYKKIPFTLTVNPVTGATILPSELVGAVTVYHGDSKTLIITADFGYNLVSIKVNGVEKISELSSDNELALSSITQDTNVVVVVEKIVYEILEGKNLKTKDLNKLKFKFDADYSKFTTGGEVYIDGNLIDDSKYTSESGSTIITLEEEYAGSLAKGNHQIKVVFNDGGEAITNFTIVDPTANPQTGDNILVYIIMLIVSTLGIITAIVLGKKKLKLQR